MYIRVDVEDTEEEIEGFSYINKDGEEEVVIANGADPYIEICTDGYSDVPIYYEDIPNLIKALKAAYKHNTGDTL